MRALGLALATALCIPGQTQPPRSSSNSPSVEERIAVIESRLGTVEKLNDRIDRLQEKIDGLSLQLQALNTKMSIIAWIGGAIGTLLLAHLFRSITTERRSSQVPDWPYVVSPTYLLQVAREELARTRERQGSNVPADYPEVYERALREAREELARGRERQG